ncbi:MAG TPA: carboxypeptidase regulatory-like domain-containing protein [Gemmatimonadales bacterium]|nr:carboxypeptidase regulatory-like domain-containing protein [Gemmatimonadales bacterium]
MRITGIAALAGLALGASAVAGVAGPHLRAAGGTISGTITYTGTPPKMKPIDMAKEPTCAKQHATPVMTEGAVTGPGNTLADVVVYISAGDQPGPAPTQPVRYDQKGCQYVPHVAVMQAGQPLEIYNDDETSHNIHPMPKLNSEWNKSQPPGTPPIHTSFDKPEFISVKCNVHPWMHGVFAVLNTSHATVSGADGSFKLEGLAPGHYTVTAWHERFGTQTADVTITGSETQTVKLVFKATPY